MDYICTYFRFFFFFVVILLLVQNNYIFAQANRSSVIQPMNTLFQKLSESNPALTTTLKQIKDKSIYKDEDTVDDAIDCLNHYHRFLRHLTGYCSVPDNSNVSQQRKVLTKEWVDFLSKLSTTIDLKHDFTQAVQMNLHVNGPYPSGIASNFIKEPDIRKDYEERLAKNTKLSLERKIQITLKDMIASVLKESSEFFVNAYGKAPRADAELVELLEKYSYPEEEKVKVLKTLKIPYQSFREWQSQDGKFKITAKFVSFDGQNIILEDKDKKRETVIFSSLRKEDQKYVKERAKGEKSDRK